MVCPMASVWADGVGLGGVLRTSGQDQWWRANGLGMHCIGLALSHLRGLYHVLGILEYVSHVAWSTLRAAM
jgi:hypothetical protein